jgi:pimeloyl-ACP methyl ester carboxylesterase
VEQLGDALRIVSLDLQGHGLTGPIPSDDYSIGAMVETVEQLREVLGIPSWSVAGNSMGGAVAWSYALEYPERVEALVLVDSAGFWPREEEAAESGALAFRLAAMPGINRLLGAVMPRSLFDTTLKQAIHDDAQVTDAMVDRYWELNRHPGTRRATRLRMMGYRERLGEVPPVEELAVPTLVMSGKEDLLIPASAAEQFHERIPDSRLVIYPDVGHVPMEEIPVRSAGDVLAFLDEVGVLSPPSERMPGSAASEKAAAVSAESPSDSEGDT